MAQVTRQELEVHASSYHTLIVTQAKHEANRAMAQWWLTASEDSRRMWLSSHPGQSPPA
jgi:hypothetical protein